MHVAPRKLLFLVFWGFLEVVGAVFLLEPLDSTCGVDVLLFARVERMTNRTDFGVDFAGSAARLKSIAATAANGYFVVFRMYSFFHYSAPITENP